MNIFRYIGRSLVRYRRNHLTEAFGIALATAITVGALGVGDSAKRSLERMARARLGLAEFAASNGGKPFSAKIADSIAVNTGTHCSALLSLPAFLSTPDGKFTLSSKINGIDSSFAELAPDNSAAERLQERQVRRSDHTENEAEDNIGISPPPPRGNNTLPPILKDNNAFVGKSVADHMQLHVGDLFTAAVPRTGFLPAELAFAGGDSAGKIVLSLKLAGILPDREFPADFALSASGDPVFNVFVSRTWLSAKLADVDSANIILAACGGSETDAEEKLNSALGNTWTFKDMGLGFRHATIPGNGHWRALVSKSIFIPRKTADAALSIPSAIGILTYFVNSIDVEKREPQNT
ncbi:MAG: hypothetical protein KAG97_03135, partial [Victivallales bacterium]|nr:hypothetical protein [Victivallales bacterium]